MCNPFAQPGLLVSAGDQGQGMAMALALTRQGGAFGLHAQSWKMMSYVSS